MSVEITKTNLAIELFTQELDMVAGGVDLSLQNTPFKENISAGHQNTSSGLSGSLATSDFTAIPKKTICNKFINNLTSHVVNTAALSGRSFTLDLFADILESAPITIERYLDDECMANSTCVQCIKEAEVHFHKGRVSEANFYAVLNFWTKEFMDYPGNNVQNHSIENYRRLLQARKDVLEVFNLIYQRWSADAFYLVSIPAQFRSTIPQ